MSFALVGAVLGKHRGVSSLLPFASLRLLMVLSAGVFSGFTVFTVLAECVIEAQHCTAICSCIEKAPIRIKKPTNDKINDNMNDS